MEEKILKALDKVLEEKYTKRAYSLNGYQEESVCLEKVDDGWVVFCGERGNHYNETNCKTILEAAITMFRYFTHNTKEICANEELLLKYLQ